MINFYNLIEENSIPYYTSPIDILLEESYAFKTDELSIITESGNENIFKKLWNRFITWVKNIWIKIKNFFKKLIGKETNEVPITSDDIVNKRESDIEKIVQKYITEEEFDRQKKAISQYKQFVKFDVSSLDKVKSYKDAIKDFISKANIKEDAEDKKLLCLPKDVYEDSIYSGTLSLISRIPYSRYTGLPEINTFDFSYVEDLEKSVTGLDIIDGVVNLMNDISNATDIDDVLSNIDNKTILSNVRTYLKGNYTEPFVFKNAYREPISLTSEDVGKEFFSGIKFPIMNMANCYLVRLNTLMYKYIFKYFYDKIKPIENIKAMAKNPKLLDDDNARPVIKSLYEYFRFLVQNITKQLNKIKSNLTFTYNFKVSSQYIEELKYYIESNKQEKLDLGYNTDLNMVQLISKKITNEIMKL